MILKDSVTKFTKTQSKNSQGQIINSFVSSGSFLADVQPATLTPDQLATFGLTDIVSNSKRMFYPRYISVALGDRLDVAGVKYEVRATNQWPAHNEAILTPYQGA